MKRHEHQHPRLLPHVLQAIADLRESGGTTARKIVDLVQANVASCPKPRNVSMQVRRALKHGLDSGIIKLRGGKYYANVVDPLRNCMTCKRRRKKGRSRRNRRRTRRHGDYEDVSEGDSMETISNSESDWDISRSRTRTPEPSDRPKRRKRKAGKRKRRRRHSMGPSGGGNDEQKQKRFDPDSKGSSEYGPLNDAELRPECSNPECICNMKQEKPEEMRGMKQDLKQEQEMNERNRGNFRNDYIN